MAEGRFSLKDHLFNERKVAYLADLLTTSIPGFARSEFEDAVMADLAGLELKARVDHIATVLESHLDDSFEVAAKQIERALPRPLDPTKTDDDFGDFILAPLGTYVERHGLDHFEISMRLIRELTMRFSMEGPIRAFINSAPTETLAVMREWVTDDNYHVRRLVSEGTRPLLPWAPRIDLQVATPLPLLDTLHADGTRYVTRSVANHLNDVSKIEPSLVIETLGKWRRSQMQEPAELGWMTKHALRTLVKRGDSASLNLLGYSTSPGATVEITGKPTAVVAGGALEFAITLNPSRDEPLLIDYAIGFVKKDGSTKPKVFKLRQLEVAAGAEVTIRKRHPLRSDATTYRLYAGTHELTIMVNGVAMASASFELTLDPPG